MASSALLQEIQKGKRLRKAETIDKSAPAIDVPKSKSGGGGGGISRAPTSSTAGGGAGGPPQLGGLFAGGMPKLKPAGQNNLGEYYIIYKD